MIQNREIIKQVVCLIFKINDKIYKLSGCAWMRRNNNKYEINILHCPTIYNKCSLIAWKAVSKSIWKIIWQKAISIPTYLPINVTICNKTIAGDKVSLESRIAISGLPSWFEKSYLLQKIIAILSSNPCDDNLQTNCSARTAIDKNFNK